MKMIVHPASGRGIQDHGWLKAAHSFSFGNYYNPARTHFGLLRVLNDDIVAPGMGFGMHPHDNMEIVTIPLSGILAHQDSIGSHGRIAAGEVQIMSAGTGIRHSEYNGSEQEPVNLLQIWVFPKERNIAPRYDQTRYDLQSHPNNFIPIVAPDNFPGALWINQDAWFNLGQFDEDQNAEYVLKKPGNGAYLFVIEGTITIDGRRLQARDAAGIYDTDSFSFQSEGPSKVLLIDLPME